jgi:uncharacterized delta-60 repeat protein
MKQLLLVFLAVSSVFAMNSSAQQIDSTFNTNGYLPYLGPNSNGEGNVGKGYASAIQPDGKIVTVLGRDINNTSDLWMYLYRYLPDGMPDPGFGTNGVVTTFCGQNSTGFDVEIQQDGKIVMIGESKYCINGVCGAKQFVMMRFKTDGVLDSTFGNNGHILTNDVFGTSGMFSIPKSLHILPNGKFMVGGRGPNGKPAIVRLNSNGFPDPTYATNGVYTFTADASASYVDMAIAPNGEAYGLTVTNTWNQSTMSYDSTNLTDNLVFKLTSNGTLDGSFGTNGVFEFGTDNTDNPFSIAFTSTGKVLVAGNNQPDNRFYVTIPFDGYGQTNKGYVAFLTASGAFDTNVPNGFSTFDLVQDSATFFERIIERSPNEFLACGFVTDFVGGNFKNKSLIVSINPQGQLNPSFNGNGTMIFDHGITGSSGWNGKLANFTDIDLAANNKIILTGYRNPIGGNTKESIYLLRLNYVPTSNLALEEFTEEADFTAYPNPVVNNHFVINSDEAATIQLVALDGRILYKSEVPEGISPITVDSDYKGLAILKLETKNGKVGTTKILFQ